MKDDQLIEGLRRGDTKTQLAVIEAYQDRLSESLLRLKALGSEDVEQIVFDVLSDVILDPAVIDLSRGSVKAFLFRSVYNRAIDVIRRRKTALGGKHLVSLDALNEEALMEAEERTLNSTDAYPNLEEPEAKTFQPPPEVIQAAKQLGTELKLSQKQYEHLRLRLVEKFEPSEVADLLGITPNNEAVSWHRLKKKIDDNWERHLALRDYAKGFDKHTKQT